MARVFRIRRVVRYQPILNIELKNLHVLAECERQYVHHRPNWLCAFWITDTSSLQNQRHLSPKAPEDAAPIRHARTPCRIVSSILNRETLVANRDPVLRGMLGHVGSKREIWWIPERVKSHRKLLCRIQGFFIVHHVKQVLPPC